MTDAQIFGDKVYLNAPNMDNDDEEFNVAVSFDDCADLAVKMDEVRLTIEGREKLRLRAATVEHGDLMFGMRVEAQFTDMGSTVLHFDNFARLTVPSAFMLDIERPIR